MGGRSVKTIPFSQIKLGRGSLRFEEKQIKYYTNLVTENPRGRACKKILSELHLQLEEDKKKLNKPIRKKVACKKKARY